MYSYYSLVLQQPLLMRPNRKAAKLSSAQSSISPLCPTMLHPSRPISCSMPILPFTMMSKRAPRQQRRRPHRPQCASACFICARPMLRPCMHLSGTRCQTNHMIRSPISQYSVRMCPCSQRSHLLITFAPDFSPHL